MNMTTQFRCPECGETTADGSTEMSYRVDDTKVTVKDVPAQICPNGHSYIDGYTAESVNRLVNHVVEDIDAYTKKLARPVTRVREVVIAA
jgi:YgiT-type zinc finger domain-containing protein